MDIFQRLWGAWKRIGQWIGDMLGRVVLTILYFTLVVPFGIIARFFIDPLAIKGSTDRFWKERNKNASTLDDARGLF